MRTTMLYRLLLPAFGLALLALPVPAQPPRAAAPDWPEFRGPGRDNRSPDKGLLTAWPKAGPRLLWQSRGLGQGFSSVSVVGDKVFTMGDRGASSFVFALNRATGKPLWSARVGRPGGSYEGTRCTPTVDNGLVYAIGQFGDLVCVEAAGGKERLRKNFQADFGGRHGAWQFSESPLIDGDRLVCTPGGPKATMVALDKKTGEEIWRCPAGDVAGYSSIVISNAGGVKQYVQLTAGGTLGVAASDGKVLWRYDALGNNTANVPTPVVLGEQVFTTAGYGKHGALLTLRAEDEGIAAVKVYDNNRLRNKHGGVTVVGDHVYGDTDDSGNPFCAEWKTGEVKWTRRQAKQPGQGAGSASLAYADGMLYIHYANGWVHLVPASPAGYTVKGAFKIPNSTDNSWAHPVVIGGRLYLRHKDMLWCYSVRKI